MYQPGDTIVLDHPRLHPKYLCGAVVEITALGPQKWAGQFAEELRDTYEGKILELRNPAPRNARFRPGCTIVGITAQIIEKDAT